MFVIISYKIDFVDIINTFCTVIDARMLLLRMRIEPRRQKEFPKSTRPIMHADASSASTAVGKTNRAKSAKGENKASSSPNKNQFLA